MPNQAARNSLDLYDDHIRKLIVGVRKLDACKWCGITSHSIVAKGLCSSCYRWSLKQQKIHRMTEGLPPKTKKDAHSTLRFEHGLIDSAVERCIADGIYMNARLEQTSEVDLESQFDTLSKRVLGPRRGSRLFRGKPFFFVDFSPMQRIWLWHLTQKILSEIQRRDRLTLAGDRRRAKARRTDVRSD